MGGIEWRGSHDLEFCPATPQAAVAVAKFKKKLDLRFGRCSIFSSILIP